LEIRYRPGTTDQPRKRSSISFTLLLINRAQNLFRPSSASPPSIRTARSGLSIRCTARWCIASTVCAAVVKAKPELANIEPFNTVLTGNREAIAKLPMDQLMKILVVTLTGMSVDDFEAQARHWLDTARDPRWKKLFTELTYMPMIELLKHMRASGYKTYIVTGGGQDFVRTYSEQMYGIPREQVVGTAGGTSYICRRNKRQFSFCRAIRRCARCLSTK
jgi:hypothetical protein